jgi:uncharacterized protein
MARPPVEEMTLRQLRKVAAEFEVFRYSRMRKSQLLEAVQTAELGKVASPNRLLARNLDIDMKDTKELVEATKFDLGEDEPTPEILAATDEALGELPAGYGESCIVLLPRDPQWGYVYWDIPNADKEQKRQEGGQQLALRLYDSTDLNLEYQSPHSIQEYPADELAREWYLPIPVSDRDYVVEIGYRCADGRWLVLSRSIPVHIPPTYPSDWIEEAFITLPWEQALVGQTFFSLISPAEKAAAASTAMAESQPSVGSEQDHPLYDQIFNLAQSTEVQRVAGSLYGSMQQSGMQVESLSSYVFPSGAGMWTGAGALSASGLSGLTTSGMGMSGIGMFSGGIRPRQFWLVADAELIVYGATEPDASVTIAGRPIKLNSDGTFRYHMSFQDGIIDYPIFALAADGEQNRSIHMKFERQTLERRTNTKEEAIPEWLA